MIPGGLVDQIAAPKYGKQMESSETLHGVSMQTVVLVCEQTFLHGQYDASRTMLCLDIMGVHFEFSQDDIGPGWSGAHKTMLLKGTGWSLTFEAKMATKEWEMRGRQWVAKYHDPPKFVRWGKEREYTLKDIVFSGDVDAFQKDMFYAMLIGDQDGFAGQVEATK